MARTLAVLDAHVEIPRQKAESAATSVLDRMVMNGSRGSALGARASSQQSWSSTGAVAAAKWVHERGIPVMGGQRWHIEIALDVAGVPATVDFDEKSATRFHLDIYSEEWGHYFCHAGRSSWIRITDVAFVHGRDEHHLLGVTPSLRDVGQLVRHLEQKNAIRFRRDLALVRTNLAGVEAKIRQWLVAL